MDARAVNLNPSNPLTFAAAYALHSAGVVLGRSLIGGVLLIGCQPQIADAVVPRSSVDVIDLNAGPKSGVQRPAYFVGLDANPIKIHSQIPLAFLGVDETASRTIPKRLLAEKAAAFWLVPKDFMQSRNRYFVHVGISGWL